MEKDIKKTLKEFKSGLKKFKKISCSDIDEAKKLAIILKKQVIEIRNLDALKSKEKEIQQFIKLEDTLNLYLLNVDALKNYQEKWGKVK